jgi:hypothetical protein
MDPDGYIGTVALYCLGYAYSKYVKMVATYLYAMKKSARHWPTYHTINFISMNCMMIIRKPLDAIIRVLLQSG